MAFLTIKVILLAASGVVFTRALSPPKRRAPEKAKGIYRGQAFEYLVRFLAYLVWLAVLPTIASTLLLALHEQFPAVAPLLCPANPDRLEPLKQITPRFLLGTILTIAGGSFRLWSYRVLGDLFTYEVVLKENHAIVSNGPYAYVRHPSYTGVILMLVGEHLMQFGDAGYVPYCGIRHTPFAPIVYSWPFIALFGAISLYRRCAVEDKQLQERFGDGWKEYAARVRWKLFPYVV
ncbi:hypothetical protein BN946_scf184983.g3 [Trametes cinnabarina]|uniref:Protein-S-isoprenylcysteine O-methyltransferase n=1 Tax=Pycnoporus cinnabarinus TaxID=5643 RepID=A0A060SDS0_PYCCI|nr:hypothetical protein BN946_scf184983.g3 [Trametes cinnabarina]